jgi:hypothetical protein
MEHMCEHCGMVIRVEYGHTLRHGNVMGECYGSNVMVTTTYAKG